MQKAKRHQFIKIKSKIEPFLKDRIETEYLKLFDGASEYEFEYISKKVRKKIDLLLKFETDMYSDLATLAAVFFKVIQKRINENKNFPETSSDKSLLAALYYFCNPIDVIPDCTPMIGFMDDAFVFNLAIEIIRKEDKELYLFLKNSSGVR